MAEKSPIEWTRGDDGAPGATWNPTTGCDRISPGCDHCYALTLAKRLKAMGASKYQNDGDLRTSGPGFGLSFHASALTQPLRWRKPRRVFVNSMSDLAHARVSTDEIAQVFAVMTLASQHTFQLLTKRPKRLSRLLAEQSFWVRVRRAARELGGPAADIGPAWGTGVLDNVWVGTSIESEDYAWRADRLRETPAAIRFLSLEPLLGPLPNLDLDGIDWVIVGGESGQQHRPLDLGWVRELRDQCVTQQVPFFFKQVGGRTPKAGGRMLDGRTWDEYPPTRGPAVVTA